MHTLGFPSWASADYPCFMCDCDRDSMFQCAGLNPLEFPFNCTTKEQYIQACGRCKVRVVIGSVAQHALLNNALTYDKRPTGSRGRALTRGGSGVAFGDGGQVVITISVAHISTYPI